MSDVLEIDGSQGEGGGSIIRLAAGFSCLYKQPIKITNIRAKRSKPGLRLQHLLGLKLLAQLTNSKLSECQIGTKEINFTPSGEFYKDQIAIQINTAASIGLLLQPIQIACLNLKTSKSLTLLLNGGGIFGKWAPSVDYLNDVTYKLFEFAGLKIETKINRYGFYPKGGALVECSISKLNQHIKPIQLNQLGKINLIEGKIIISSKLKGKNRIAERIKNSIKKEMKSNNYDVEIRHKWVETYSPGIGLHLFSISDTGAIISTGTIIGERKMSSEKIGTIASKKILNYIHKNIPVDEYLSDQLIPIMAYAKGSSRMKVDKITNHTKSNLELLKIFNKRNYSIKRGKLGYFIDYF